MTSEALPEWVIYIGGIIGTSIAAIFIRMGWKAGGGSPSSGSAQIEGALVDSSSVKQLAAAVEAMNMTVMTIHRDSETIGKARVETLQAMVTAIKELNSSVKRQIEIALQEEEHRDRRERERIERENERLARENEQLRASQRDPGGFMRRD